MLLHEDRASFQMIIGRISERTGIQPGIIEKDYYVSLCLSELAGHQKDVPAFFKGGTCLYKAYLPMRRFSEDIDLTVQTQGMTNSHAKRVLEKSAYGYTCMTRLKDNPMAENRKGSITAVYGYDPAFQVKSQDRLQRYGKLKIESTSFTISELVETRTLSSLIYQYANDEERTVLQQRFDMHPFSLQCIRMERIFADKLLAAEFYLERKEWFDIAKHVYDLTVMLDQPAIQKMLSDDASFIRMLSYKRREEKVRIGSDLDAKPLADFLLFAMNSRTDAQLQKTFSRMERIYVIHKEDKLPFSKVLDAIDKIKNRCLDISQKERASLAF
ncbi:MAG: nucleotidyl transferase AbiEii/AbiGii toxin family protein [Bilifractor sp.]